MILVGGWNRLTHRVAKNNTRNPSADNTGISPERIKCLLLDVGPLRCRCDAMPERG